MTHKEQGTTDTGGLSLTAPHSIRRLLAELAITGVAHRRGITPGKFAQLAEHLGRTIQKTDVEVRPTSRPLVTSDRALGPHTDHHAARYVAWRCERQTDVGGETFVVDAWQALAALPARTRARLEEIHLREHAVFPDDPASRPLVSYREGLARVYYSFWLVNNDLQNDPAVVAFEAAVSAAPRLRFKLAPGDALFIDNHRMLHGRTAIGGNRDRLLRRRWIAERQASNSLTI